MDSLEQGESAVITVRLNTALLAEIENRVTRSNGRSVVIRDLIAKGLLFPEDDANHGGSTPYFPPFRAPLTWMRKQFPSAPDGALLVRANDPGDGFAGDVLGGLPYGIGSPYLRATVIRNRSYTMEYHLFAPGAADTLREGFEHDVTAVRVYQL